MKNEEPKIWVTVAETINTGPYESVKVEAGFSKTYSEKDDPLELLDSEIDKVRNIVKKKANKIRKKKNK